MPLKSIGEIEYTSILPIERASVLPECAELYSKHYGIWGAFGDEKKRGKNIQLSVGRLNNWFLNEQTNLYVARLNGALIGYAIALRDNLSNHGTVSWVTQFVVHKEYRNKGIGSHLLRHIWGMSNDYAWGLITANPYAIRALEKATRRICDPIYISNSSKNCESKADKLLNFADGKIEYVTKEIEKVVNKETSQLNTEFAVDHADIDERIRSLKNNGISWNMGDLRECWEWFAFTFRKQVPFPLDKSEIADILNNSEAYVKQAYRRMLGGIGSTDEGKPYTKHTSYEVDFIVKECNLHKDSIVFDFGCGNGRHSIELVNKVAKVYSFDYIEGNINICNAKAEYFSKKPIFQCADCRELYLDEKADAIICLYDVIGSYTKEEDNLRIIRNIARHLKVGGTAIISVMNSQIIQNQVAEFSFTEEPNALFELEASSTMQKTGEVFNPMLMLFDRDEGVFYRKEQFMLGVELPVELIVSDRRYTADSISRLCENAGLNVELIRYVHAGDWITNIPPTGKKAKEILLKCTKTM